MKLTSCVEGGYHRRLHLGDDAVHWLSPRPVVDLLDVLTQERGRADPLHPRPGLSEISVFRQQVYDMAVQAPGATGHLIFQADQDAGQARTGAGEGVGDDDGSGPERVGRHLDADGRDGRSIHFGIHQLTRPRITGPASCAQSWRRPAQPSPAPAEVLEDVEQVLYDEGRGEAQGHDGGGSGDDAARHSETISDSRQVVLRAQYSPGCVTAGRPRKSMESETTKKTRRYPRVDQAGAPITDGNCRPQPHWKTATMAPYAAPTLSRFMMTWREDPGERNTIIRRMNERIGRRRRRGGGRGSWRRDAGAAVCPPTCAFTDVPLVTGGMTSFLRSGRAPRSGRLRRRGQGRR